MATAVKKMVKSKSLLADEAACQPIHPAPMVIPKQADLIKIKPLQCYLDWIAILRFTIVTEGIDLPANSQTSLDNKGIVVGVSPHLTAELPAGDGSVADRPYRPQVGHVVLFSPKAIVQTVMSRTGIYAEQQVVFVAERNVMCRLDDVPYEIVKSGS